MGPLCVCVKQKAGKRPCAHCSVPGPLSGPPPHHGTRYQIAFLLGDGQVEILPAAILQPFFFFFLKVSTVEFKRRETQPLEKTVSHVLPSYSSPFPHGHQQMILAPQITQQRAAKLGATFTVYVLLPCL